MKPSLTPIFNKKVYDKYIKKLHNVLYSAAVRQQDL